MSTYALPRDFYDLNSTRRRLPLPRDVPVGKMDDTMREFEVARTMLKAHNRKLNILSDNLRSELQKRDALTFALSFLNCALGTPMNMSVYAAMPPAIAKAPRSRPDSEKEEEELINRIEWTRMDQLGDQVLRQSVRLLGDAVRQKQRDHGDPPDYPKLLYRLHSPESHTFYANDVGFCSARWVHQRNFAESSAQDFRDHCDGKSDFHSPYISMTESPWRLLLYARNHELEEVFIIDAEKLWATRIQVERTTELAKEWGLPYTGRRGRVHYVTETHWVAKGWIPLIASPKGYR